MRWAATFLAAALAATPALAEDHLVPENGAINGAAPWQLNYEAVVAVALQDAFQSGVVVRMVALPSFHSEFAVGIEDGKDDYRIFYVHPSVMLWQHEAGKPDAPLTVGKNGEIEGADAEIARTSDANLQNMKTGLPSEYSDVKIIRCSIPIDKGLAHRIAGVWRTMLYDTRYESRGVIGADGAFYHFSMFSDLQMLAGQTWTPQPDTQPGMLVGIGLAMADYCEKKDPKLLVELTKQVSALEKKLH